MSSACRVGTWQSDRQRGRRRDGRFSLSSAPGALGKEGFADQFFAVCFLPSAALGKGFAECNLAFGKEPESSSDSCLKISPFRASQRRHRIVSRIEGHSSLPRPFGGSRRHISSSVSEGAAEKHRRCQMEEIDIQPKKMWYLYSVMDEHLSQMSSRSTCLP